MIFRYRIWGSSEWTSIKIEGELDYIAAGCLGSALSRFHVQQLVDGRWEDLT